MKQKGMSLIEAMLVLALAAVVIIAAIHYYSQVRESEKVTTLVGQINGIMSAAQKCVAGSAGSMGNGQNNISNCLSLNSLINAGFLSSYYSTSPWGVMIANPANNGTAIQIVVANVPHTACLAIESQLNTQSNTAMSVVCGARGLTVTESY